MALPLSQRMEAPMIVSVPKAAAGRALRFVVLLGIVSLFADCTYEGSRSILGQFLASLKATGTIVGIVTGFGELVGYALRLGSGSFADMTRAFWPIIIIGYALQMSSVPALALATTWPVAAILIILERVGKALRNPPRDVLLSYAGERIGGFGWAFGLHQAFDQTGAVIGPLLVAAMLAVHGSYKYAFGVLVIPASINLALVGIARLSYPHPEELARKVSRTSDTGFSRKYWVYVAAACLVAIGFIDYPLIAFHLKKSHVVSGDAIAAFYAVAMAVSGTGSLVLGRLFDKFGFSMLVLVTFVSSFFAPLIFLGGFWLALSGAALWGLGMGFQESIIPAAVTPLVHGERRASAFGLFTAAYGLAWFFGSAIVGILYDRFETAVVPFCMATQFLALPIFWWLQKNLHSGDNESVAS